VIKLNEKADETNPIKRARPRCDRDINVGDVMFSSEDGKKYCSTRVFEGRV